MQRQVKTIYPTSGIDPINGFDPNRVIHWTGNINSDSCREITNTVRSMIVQDAIKAIYIIVTSPGGASGVAMSFFDSMRHIYKPNLETIGSGDVDSAGIVVFLSGLRRHITPNTTLLLHLASRTFPRGRRVSTLEMEAMLKEDKLKDFQYASIVAEHSNGRLSAQDVLVMMANNTVLTPTEAVDFGLAHKILH